MSSGNATQTVGRREFFRLFLRANLNSRVSRVQMRGLLSRNRLEFFPVPNCQRWRSNHTASLRLCPAKTYALPSMTWGNPAYCRLVALGIGAEPELQFLKKRVVDGEERKQYTPLAIPEFWQNLRARWPQGGYARIWLQAEQVWE